MALPALATVSQLEAWMQADPGTLPDSAGMVLDVASAIIRSEARNQFVRKTSTLLRRPRQGVVKLPLRPVVSVDSVTRDGAPVDFIWDSEDEALYVGGYTAVSVTFTHGYGEVPRDVLAVVLTAVQRVLNNPSDLRQETVGSMSVTYAAETIGASLSQADRDLLARYRRRTAVVRLV